MKKIFEDHHFKQMWFVCISFVLLHKPWMIDLPSYNKSQTVNTEYPVGVSISIKTNTELGLLLASCPQMTRYMMTSSVFPAHTVQ